MSWQFDSLLGAVARPKDRRDFNLGQYQAPVPVPETYATDISKVVAQFQGNWPACGAHAGAHFKEIQEKGGSFSPAFLWNEIKEIDNFPTEVGTDIRSIFKTLYSKGVCDYTLLPNDYSLDLTRYTHQQITPEMYDNAKPKGISGYAFSDFPSVAELKQSIFLNKQVVILIWCDNGFFNTDKPTFTEKKYGHFVVAYGWTKDAFLILDSSESDHHYKEIPFTAIGFIREVGTAIDLPDRFIFKNTLYFGLRDNTEVKELQKRLGVYPATGNFGPLTLSAVRNYQKAHGIISTGIVGPLTRTSLNTT